MKKFGGPGPGPYEKNTGIGEIPAAGPCDVKGLRTYRQKTHPKNITTLYILMISVFELL